MTVTTNGGTSNGINFTVTSAADLPPTIDSITPNVGSVEGGSNITIAGSGFTPDTRVYIGENESSGVALVSSSSLKVTTPPGMAGSADVLLTNANGDAFLPGGFTYLEGPTQQVVAINPTMGLTSIPINTNITVLFARPVDGSTINGSSISLVETSSAAPVSGAFSFDFGDTAAIFRPNASLKPNTSYTLYITRDIKSIDGIPLDLPFSEPINPVTVNTNNFTLSSDGTVYSGRISFSNQNAVATFIPDQPLPAMTLITVNLAAGIADAAGNAIPTAFTSSFTTQSGQDNFRPSVILVSPYNNQAGVALNSVGCPSMGW